MREEHARLNRVGSVVSTTFAEDMAREAAGQAAWTLAGASADSDTNVNGDSVAQSSGASSTNASKPRAMGVKRRRFGGFLKAGVVASELGLPPPGTLPPPTETEEKDADRRAAEVAASRTGSSPIGGEALSVYLAKRTPSLRPRPLPLLETLIHDQRERSKGEGYASHSWLTLVVGAQKEKRKQEEEEEREREMMAAVEKGKAGTGVAPATCASADAMPAPCSGPGPGALPAPLSPGHVLRESRRRAAAGFEALAPLTIIN
jgi:hypothetical protein